jgi:hypothetical protein
VGQLHHFGADPFASSRLLPQLPSSA